ncbi:hypothetical protein [Paenibacillus sp. P36]|uniref:hypothetical protein n=1 Tax=Paenibacillus sp. P36 TaxID=3342538 RepID=UPI0038B23844
MDSRLIELLENIKKRPGLYLGRKSLLFLLHFLHGYQQCLFHIEGTYYTLTGFQEYIEDIYDFHGVHNWASIIQFNCTTDDEAFDKFYQHLDEFYGNMDLTSENKI